MEINQETTVSEKNSPDKTTWKKDLFQLILFVAALFLLRTFVLGPLVVEGVSMHPTLETNDKGWVVKLGSPKRFDIVNFHVPASVVQERPDQKGHVYVKRVIGLPGDTVEIKQGDLYINGVKTAEPYLTEQKNSWTGTEPFSQDYSLKMALNLDKIPADKYLVMGDNRPESYDGRFFGLIDRSEIIGILKFRFWPLDRIGVVD